MHQQKMAFSGRMGVDEKWIKIGGGEETHFRSLSFNRLSQSIKKADPMYFHQVG